MSEVHYHGTMFIKDSANAAIYTLRILLKLLKLSRSSISFVDPFFFFPSLESIQNSFNRRSFFFLFIIILCQLRSQGVGLVSSRVSDVGLIWIYCRLWISSVSLMVFGISNVLFFWCSEIKSGSIFQETQQT